MAQSQKKIVLGEVITKEQLVMIYDFWTTNPLTMHRFVRTDPKIAEACAKHDLLPAYFGYFLEYLFTAPKADIEKMIPKDTKDPRT